MSGLLTRIIQMEKEVCESSSLPNELLYGRAGYLYTLLLLQTELGETIISKQSIINVSMVVIQELHMIDYNFNYWGR